METIIAECHRMRMVGIAFSLLSSVTFSSTVVLAEPTKTTTRTETFDHDPKWDSHNNRQTPKDPPIVLQDFGYFRTMHAGSEAGEIGGRVSASLRPAWYGKVIDGGTFDDSLTASGSLSVHDAASISGWQTSANIYVGWFRADPRDLIWRPRNFIGFRLQSSNEPDGCLVELSYGTRAWQAGGAFVNAAGGVQQENVRDLETSRLLRIPPDGSRHHWSFRYDPAATGGGGEILFVFDQKETRLKMGAEHRIAGATFNRFGIFSPRIPGRHIVAYFDELTIDGDAEDFSKDPGWESVGNHERFEDPAQYAYNDFGFSKTNHAGGKLGELGGRFFSCNPDEDQFKAYCGDRVGELTMEHRLTARGKFVANEHSTDSTFALGWFNSKKQGWPIENFVGVYFDSYSSVGRIVEPLYGTSMGTDKRGGGYLTFEPTKRYEWTLDYDPDAEEGQGAITFTLGDQRVTKPFDEGEREKGAIFDRFGLFNMQWANSKWCDVYFDDLTYTVSASSASTR